MSRSFAVSLCAWYHSNARDLPWRRTRDPYRIWVSEVMLQQTTVNTVIPYYRHWVRTFPTLVHLARATPQKVLRAWQGLGYYRRAINLHRSARVLCRDFNGRFPEDENILKQLPGFGDYTTAAVLSIAFNRRLPLIDTNARRVLLRLHNIRTGNGKDHEHCLREFLMKNLPRRNINIFNQALMELGALVCRPHAPLCQACPLRLSCQAVRQGDPGAIGTKPKKMFERIRVGAALIEHKNKYFIQRRPPGGLLGDLWEFPGGKAKGAESIRQTLAREIKEELGVRLMSTRAWIRIRHSYTRFKVDLHVWFCRTKPLPKADRSHKWVGLRNLGRYPMPAANAKILVQLQKQKKGENSCEYC